MPVALATMACSKEIFRAVREACHHVRVLAPLLGKSLLRSRVAMLVLQSLDVAADQRRDAETLDEAPQVELHAGLIAIAAGENHAGFLGVLLQNRADRSVELGVHRHHVLLVLDRAHGDDRAELYRPGGIDQTVDVVGVEHQVRVLRDDRLSGADRVLKLSLAGRHQRLGRTVLDVRAPGARERAVADCDQLHAGNRVEDVVRETAAHEARADHADANGPSLGFTLPERYINDQHRRFSGLYGAHFWSFSEMTSIGTGHLMPSAGSS